MSESIYRGNFKEFKKFIGPSLTNTVQYISRKHKKEKGKCEDCGSKDKLQAAHIEGKERLKLIEGILNRYYSKGKDMYEVPLVECLEKFKKIHQPIYSIIRVLCETCHIKYDKKDKKKK
jgi:hypothetical protein